MIDFVLMVNKQGQTRLAHYYSDTQRSLPDKIALESELVRRCLRRTEDECSLFKCQGFHVNYRRYASLYFIVGVNDTNAKFMV